MEELSLALTHRLGDTLKENRPSLPSWALPSTTTALTPSTTNDNADEEDEEDEEALSYWNQVKETLDKEAQERKLERKVKWQEFLKQQR
jgi:hypothetical protein